MTLDGLKRKLSRYGDIQIIKEGVVFSLLITGTGLSKSNIMKEIPDLVLGYAGDKYPFIEAMRNEETFFCLILKPKP